MGTKTTGQVAEALGLSEPRLQELIRRRKITPPKKVGHRRLWKPKDEQNARLQLAAYSAN